MVTTSPRPHRSPETPRRSRWILVTLAVALLAAIATIVALTIGENGGTPSRSTPISPAPSASTSPSTSPSVSPSTPKSNSPGPPPFQLGYQPLYPFANRTDVLAWLASYHSGGHQPWHLDAASTAQAFTTGYLGFNELDRVTSRVSDSLGAHIGVGYRNPNGDLQTAAVLHLARYGPETDAPWEVVGSDDTTFSIDTPRYGSLVSSPVTVGGHISGIDENVRVAMRQLSSAGPLGQSAGLPAGGDHQPWSVSVRFSGASSSTLMIVATTGGHVQQVGRFVVQGVRA